MSKGRARARTRTSHRGRFPPSLRLGLVLVFSVGVRVGIAIGKVKGSD